MAKPIPDYIRKRYDIDDLTSSLDLLRIIDERGPVSQAQVAEATGLSVGTCNLHFRKLEYIGLIRSVETVSKGRGRSTRIWELDHGRNFCLLLLFDAPFLDASLVDFKGRAVLERREKLGGTRSCNALVKKIDRFMEEAFEHAGQADGQIRQAFVGMPGMLDPHSGVVVSSETFPAFNGMDFQALMQRHGLPCRLLGLGYYHGEVRHLPPDTHAFILDWNHGVCAVAGVGERVISQTNRDSMLSRVGHVVIERDGRPCHCGERGCLEAYAGGWAMIEILGDRKIRNVEDFCDAVQEGNIQALEIAKEAAFTLGRSLTWSLQVMQSRRLVVTGPLSRIFPLVRDRFVDGLSTIFTEARIAELDPVASSDPFAAMQYGAYRCARRQFFHPDD